jgi:hypothetical protein
LAVQGLPVLAVRMSEVQEEGLDAGVKVGEK